jgi:hypothetical protein
MIEYGSLLGDAPGVPGFPSEPIRGLRFVGEQGVNGQLDADVHEYVAGLIASAKNHGRLPILACTRLLGRSSGLKQAFGGYHILLVRNLFQQWNSFAGQLRFNNPYFLEFLYHTIALSERDKFVAYLSSYIPEDRKYCFEAWACEDNFDRAFCYFIGFHIYFLLRTYRNADLVVDINELARSGDCYRKDIEGKIKKQLGVPVDLGGVMENIDYPLFLLKSPAECAAIIDIMAERAMEACSANADERAFVESLLRELWNEHKSFSRCTTGVRDLIQTYERQICQAAAHSEAALRSVEAESQRSQELSARVEVLERQLSQSDAQAGMREAELNEALTISQQQLSDARTKCDAAIIATADEVRWSHELSARMKELEQELARTRRDAELITTLSQIQWSLEQHHEEEAQAWSRIEKLEADRSEIEHKLTPRLATLLGQLLDQPLAWRLLPSGHRRLKFLQWLSSYEHRLDDSDAAHLDDEQLAAIAWAGLSDPQGL